MDFKRLIGELVTIRTMDGHQTMGGVAGVDDDGWIFIQVYTKVVAIDPMAIVSVVIPEGYLGKNVIKKEE